MKTEELEMTLELNRRIVTMETKLRCSLARVMPNLDWNSKNLADLVNYACSTIDVFADDMKIRGEMMRKGGN